MTKLISNNKIKGGHFHSTKRFTDDLCAIIDGGEFGCTNSEICLKNLSLSQKIRARMYSSYILILIYRNNHPEVLIGKGVLKICSKFTWEHPCRSVISVKWQSNFIEITLRNGCSPVNRTPFTKKTPGRLLLNIVDGKFVYKLYDKRDFFPFLFSICWRNT